MKLQYSEKRIVFDFVAMIIISWAVGLSTGGALMSQSVWALLFAGLSILLFIAFLYVGEDWVRHEIGNRGEFKVQTILNELWPKGVRSLHNLILSDRGDIDHVAVAPSGIWVIETKSITGVFSRNTIRKKFLTQTYAEAMAVKRYLASKGLNHSVQPILALAGKYTKVEFTEPLDGVFVLSSLDLKKRIVQDIKPVLSKAEIERIVVLLKQSQNT